MIFDRRPKQNLKDIDLSAFAFYQGAQGIPLVETLHEIVAVHDQERAKLQEQSSRREKPLEAELQTFQRLRPRVDAAWLELLRRTGHHAPPVGAACLVTVLGVGALVVDAILLGPGLDAVGISDLVLQWIAAFGMAALSSLVFHLAHETFDQNRLSLETRVAWRTLGVVAVLGLLGWGTLRGLQVKFGADLNQNPLGNFLGEHPMLSSIFFCFVTLAAPLVGAAAIHHAAPLIREWLMWKRAKKAHEELHNKLNGVQKKLELERSALQHRLRQLEAQQVNWQALAAQYHQRGRICGARQTPHWLVLLKATAWSLGGLVLGSVFGTYLPALYFALPAGAWVVAFLHYRHRRFHPTYEQFKRLESTSFVEDARQPRIVRSAAPLLLPPEDRR